MSKVRVFHLASSLGPCAVGKRLSLLVPELAGKVEQRVGCLSESWPFGERIEAVKLPIRYPADVSGFLAVRRAVREFRPDVVHAWGPLAVRVAGLVGHARRAVFANQSRHAERAQQDGPRLFLSQLSETDRFTNYLAGRMTRIELPSCVRIETRKQEPSDPPVIVAVGGCDRRSGLRTAIWAFDILKYSWPGLRLLVVGDGPGRPALEQFASALGFDDLRVSFLGRRPDVPDILRTATLVWAPAVTGGVNVVLEALAAGVPVVALANSDIAGVPVGRVVPAGDRIQLAKVTHALLADAAERDRLGDAGKLAADRFAVGPVARRLLAAYSGETTHG